MNKFNKYLALKFLKIAIISATAISSLVAWSNSEHEHHHESTGQSTSVKRSLIQVEIPAPLMIRQDGSIVNLKKEFETGMPTILAFIYTSCTTVCPVTSQILSHTQNLMGKEIEKVRIVSISIDPEFDTPNRLLAYSQKFSAKKQWQHYTGTFSNSVAFQKAFSAYRGDKMNHDPLIFINGGNKKTWVQLDGFPSAEQVIKEYKEQIRG